MAILPYCLAVKNNMMSTIKALTVHKAVQPLARKVKLVTCTEERNWRKEEVARLRKITGEGDGFRFRIVKDVDDLVRLMRGGGIFLMLGKKAFDSLNHEDDSGQ